MKKDKIHRIGLILLDNSHSCGTVPLKEEHIGTSTIPLYLLVTLVFHVKPIL